MFEQSGTFKRAFQKQGITAFDYDIRNDFYETDKVVDLFCEIEIAYLRSARFAYKSVESGTKDKQICGSEIRR